MVEEFHPIEPGSGLRRKDLSEVKTTPISLRPESIPNIEGLPAEMPEVRHRSTKEKIQNVVEDRLATLKTALNRIKHG